jgi:AcrR family transcriptional regulator
MARQRSIPDELIVEAALALMNVQGPEALTLAEVGALVELSAATLVQRFGSKENLKRVALELAWDKLDEATARADAEQPETFEGAIGVIAALWPSAETSPDFAGGLLLLREDLRDPVLRARGVAWLETLALALGRRITAEPTLRRKLGRLMVSQWQGAQIWWAFSRKGTPREMIANDLRDWYGSLNLRR